MKSFGFGPQYWLRRIARAIANWRTGEPEEVVAKLIATVRYDEASKCRALIVPADDAPRRWIAERIRLHRKALRVTR